MNSETETEIDLLQLAKALWKHIVLIIVVGIVAGIAAFGGTKLFVTPLYEAKALMYVNSSNISVGGAKVSISSAEISAAKSLVETYSVILKTRLTLNDVIEQSGVNRTYDDLLKMVEASAVNNTEVFQITVTSPYPDEAELLANTIAQILPEKIASVVEGSSARVVDYAVRPAKQASPNARKNAMIGAVLGVFAVCAVIVVMELLDDKIHDTDYLVQNYDIPVLAVIPDLAASSKGSYYYYEKTDNRGRKGN